MTCARLLLRDPDQNYQETEEDEKWREEQEAKWEQEQAAEREAAARAKEEVSLRETDMRLGPVTLAANSSSFRFLLFFSFQSAAASSATASAGTAAAPVSASGASSTPVIPPSDPRQWSTSHVVSWLKGVETDVLKRGDIFASKGWTSTEVSNWQSTVSLAFSSASSRVETNGLTGATLAQCEPNETAWGDKLGLEHAYHRAAILANWRQKMRAVQ